MTEPSERATPDHEQALREAEEEVRRLDAARAAAEERLAALRRKRDADVAMAPASSTTGSEPRTTREKVKIFLQLFRGRDDVYPVRFERKPPAKPGYAPDCSNKWVRPLCGLPKVKCSECTNQAFRQFDERAVLRHLKG